MCITGNVWLFCLMSDYIRPVARILYGGVGRRGADFRKVDLYIIFSKKVNPDFFPVVAENLKGGGGIQERSRGSKGTI